MQVVINYTSVQGYGQGSDEFKSISFDDAVAHAKKEAANLGSYTFTVIVKGYAYDYSAEGKQIKRRKI